MLSKVLSILFTVYSAKWFKKRLSASKSPRKKKKEYSSQLLQSEEHTVREGETEGGGWGWGPCEQRKGRERGRDSLLMSIWWVFCWSRDLFVLLLIPESFIPPSLCKRAQRRRCRCSMRLVLASCQRQLIGSSWIDPRSFPHLNCDLILLSGPFGMYLNAMLPYYIKYDLNMASGYSSSKSASLTLDKAVHAVQYPQKR